MYLASAGARNSAAPPTCQERILRQILIICLFRVRITQRATRPTIDSAVLHYAYPQGRSELKSIIGTGLCVIGTILWAATLIATPTLVDLTVISLGVIIGGGITASGIILICLPTNRIRFSYFDKT